MRLYTLPLLIGLLAPGAGYAVTIGQIDTVPRWHHSQWVDKPPGDGGASGGLGPWADKAMWRRRG